MDPGAPREKADLRRLQIDRSAAPRPSRAGWLAFALLAVGFAGWHGYRAWSAASDPRPAVELGRVRRVGGAAATTGVAANGYVIAQRRAALSTDIQGRLVELRVAEGDRVAEGELVARLDTRQLQASHRRTENELAEARADLRLAEREHDRYRALVAKRVSPPAELDDRVARLDRARARVEALAAALAEIEVAIDKSSVYAPFAGVITAKNAEVGEVVSSIGAGPNARGAVATLVDFESLEIQVELAQTSLHAVALGAPAVVYLDAWPEDGIRGQVRQVIPTANRQKATVEVRVALAERDDRVLPEMGARVVFADAAQAAPEPVVVVVPAAAVAGERDTVFVYGNDAVTRRTVVLGERKGGDYVVESGLDGDELVVLDPPPTLVDGAAVRRKEESG